MKFVYLMLELNHILMTPKKYTKKGELIIFHYSYKDLNHFIKTGKEFGDVGFIIIKKDGNLITYRGFGTIEKPTTTLITLAIVHFPPFDGEFNLDSIMNPPLPPSYKLRFKLLDFSSKKQLYDT